ncbi:neutral/alkaline non-lysosomal ceramidase N-terminal domain-containing protein [Solimonas soli]|uniref:neutral/alkaline non-lysosomal ceramidase N-terminal domain-containing protein n=1 Tax=Solimonas soli TaxID=413479 RepID=UPI0004848A97|nr:neutral/alkaline non-lysosomal ceramidase N-terminal domain-containing protein [Solimonas soli]
MSGWLAGAGKREIAFEGGGFGMLGYGRAEHVIERRETALYSRAFCFAGIAGAPLFFAQSEICMMLPEVKRAVLERLARAHPGLFDDERLLLCAQHTHSAPGGYAHFPFYNFSIPGFRPPVFEAIVGSLVEALAEAWQRRRPARLRFAHGDFPADADVAFNRSLAAHNRNPQVEKRTPREAHLAIERTMWLLEARDDDGRAIGQINWFGVHPTSVGNRNRYVSYDNKGYAAEELEAALGDGAVAIFAQQFAGDVSPNAQSADKGWPRGRYADDTESARFNGRLQREQAQRILGALDARHELAPGATDAALAWRDMGEVEVDADLAGLSGERTVAPCHGLAFFAGSPVDGPGAPAPVVALLGALARAAEWRERRAARRDGGATLAAVEAKYRAQAPKRIVAETAAGRIVGITRLRRLPGFLDRMVAELRREDASGALDEKPWVPQVLPLQVWRLGALALIGFPGEITTEAGRQLRALCLEALAPLGVAHVVVSSYANAYFGYCTTWHEYQAQQYEGGHTTFGSRTHDAFRTEYRKLLRECAKPPAERRPARDAPKVFSAATLMKRTRA